MKTDELWVIVKPDNTILEDEVYDDFYKAIDYCNHKNKYTGDLNVYPLSEYVTIERL